jgi:hypothetical protein
MLERGCLASRPKQAVSLAELPDICDHPCATLRLDRVLRSAWTAKRLTGSLLSPCLESSPGLLDCKLPRQRRISRPYFARGADEGSKGEMPLGTGLMAPAMETERVLVSRKEPAGDRRHIGGYRVLRRSGEPRTGTGWFANPAIAPAPTVKIALNLRDQVFAKLLEHTQRRVTSWRGARRLYLNTPGMSSSSSRIS